MDASKQLLEVSLDDAGVGSLSKDLQEIVVSNEVETGEDGALLLCVCSQTIDNYIYIPPSTVLPIQQVGIYCDNLIPEGYKGNYGS